MLREAYRLANEQQRIVVFLEPIALYMTRDLHEQGDGLWSFEYPDAEQGGQIELGQIGQYGEGKDLAIISYANGYYLSRQAEKILSEQFGLNLRVIDLRWLAPLNQEAILGAIAPCRHVLIVDECRKTGSQSEALMAMIVEKSARTPALKRLAADDCFIPLGPAAMSTLPGRDTIVQAALELVNISSTIQNSQVWI